MARSRRKSGKKRESRPKRELRKSLKSGKARKARKARKAGEIDYDYIIKTAIKNTGIDLYVMTLGLLPLTAMYLKNSPYSGFKAFSDSFNKAINTMDRHTQRIYGFEYKKLFGGYMFFRSLTEFIWAVVVDKLGYTEYKETVIKYNNIQNKTLIPLITAMDMAMAVHAYLTTPSVLAGAGAGAGVNEEMIFNPCSSCLDTTCVICMEEIDNPTENRECVQLGCRHCFHITCIRQWINTDGRHPPVCPTCRTLI
jgi:hypothetical protein